MKNNDSDVLKKKSLPIDLRKDGVMGNGTGKEREK